MIDLFLLTLVGFLVLLVGVAFKLYPPKVINPWAGFRTRLAMSSQVLWDEGNRYGALLFIKIGLFSVALGLMFSALDLGEYYWVVYAITIFLMVAGIFQTNRHLEKFSAKTR